MAGLLKWLEKADAGLARLSVLAMAVLVFVWVMMAGTALLGFQSGWWPLVGGLVVVVFLTLFEVLLHDPQALLGLPWVRLVLGLAGLLRSALAILAIVGLTRQVDQAIHRLDPLTAGDRWTLVWDYLLRIVGG